MQAPKHSIKMTIHYQLFNELSNSHLATHWCVQWDHQKIHGQKEFWIAYLTPHLFYIREHFHSLLIDKAQQLTRMSANQSNSCEETLTSKVSVAVVLYCFQYRSVLLSMLFFFFLYDILLLLLCHIFQTQFYMSWFFASCETPHVVKDFYTICSDCKLTPIIDLTEAKSHRNLCYVAISLFTKTTPDGIF